MKKLLITGLTGLSLVVGVSASEKRDTTFNIYEIGVKIDKDQDSSVGAGIMFDSEAVKVKLEATSDFIKSAVVLKFNPFDDNWHIKVGANYINQKMYAPDDTNSRVNQYSGTLATGYMIQDSLYFELGGSYTQLNGNIIGSNYEVVDETTSLAYFEVAKRWFNILDTTVNAGQVFYEFIDDKFSYGIGVDYYPTNNSKIGFNYQNEKNNILSIYSLQYGYVFAEYIDSISSDIYQVNTGVKIAFTDIADFSTYTMPKNIKPHLSELHRFESVAFAVNMEMQSNGVVEKIADVAISNPTISMANQSIAVPAGAGLMYLPTPTVTNVVVGAIYSTGGIFTIDAVTGVIVFPGSLSKNNYTITIKVLNPDGGESSTTFILTVL